MNSSFLVQPHLIDSMRGPQNNRKLVHAIEAFKGLYGTNCFFERVAGPKNWQAPLSRLSAQSRKRLGKGFIGASGPWLHKEKCWSFSGFLIIERYMWRHQPCFVFFSAVYWTARGKGPKQEKRSKSPLAGGAYMEAIRGSGRRDARRHGGRGRAALMTQSQ